MGEKKATAAPVEVSEPFGRVKSWKFWRLHHDGTGRAGRPKVFLSWQGPGVLLLDAPIVPDPSK